jgi:hypothetical protein
MEKGSGAPKENRGQSDEKEMNKKEIGTDSFYLVNCRVHGHQPIRL